MSSHDEILTVHARRDLSYQLRPVHPTGVANDVDTRQPSALDQVVAGSCRLQAAHQANLFTQLAADADLVVMECLEEPQHPGLQRGGHAAPAAADIGDTGHRLLTDQMM